MEKAVTPVLSVILVLSCYASGSDASLWDSRPCAQRNICESDCSRDRAIRQNYGNLPLSFEPSNGQANEKVLFLRPIGQVAMS